MNSISVGSLNVRGLGDIHKRREIFTWLREKKHNIILKRNVQKIKKLYGKESGVPNVDLTIAKEQHKACAFCFKITLNLKLLMYLKTIRADISLYI